LLISWEAKLLSGEIDQTKSIFLSLSLALFLLNSFTFSPFFIVLSYSNKVEADGVALLRVDALRRGRCIEVVFYHEGRETPTTLVNFL
jgi:hypothetical protein